jgi:RNA polymerase sigma factor (sigma-70 family)
MTKGSLHSLLHYLRRLGPESAEDESDDGQLLRRFVASHDESAFTTIVQRYGAMVWGLCVRRLGESPEAEDAFQATFLVLVRKAASLRRPEQLGPWLYGVAYRTALKLRGQRAHRAKKEMPLSEQPADKERTDSLWRDLRPILDEEVIRLPAKYRLPVLLCYLQGVSSEEAAQRLRCAQGTVYSRLSRARDLLRRRLIRRGMDVSAGALAVVLAEKAVARAAPSAVLCETTIRTSLLYATGTASPALAAFVEGVLRSMFLRKLKIAFVLVLVLGLIGSGAGLLAQRSGSDSPSRPPVAGTDKEKNKTEKAAIAQDKDPTKAAADKAKTEKTIRSDEERFPRTFRDRLNQQVQWEGIEDARNTLTDALDALSKRYQLHFHISDKAFQAEIQKSPLADVEDIGRFEIALKKPVPEQHNVKLSTVLNVLLERLPPKLEAMYVIRKDYIEITTAAAVRAELGIPADRPLLPLVWESFENIPIAEALVDLSAHSGYNVAVDPTVADKTKTPTGIVTLYNVPVDTAARLLASMADVSLVQVENVFYLTTPEKAKRLREEKP